MHPCVKVIKIKIAKMKGHIIFQRGDLIVKLHWLFKIYCHFSRTTGPISTQNHKTSLIDKFIKWKVISLYKGFSLILNLSSEPRCWYKRFCLCFLQLKIMIWPIQCKYLVYYSLLEREGNQLFTWDLFVPYLDEIEGEIIKMIFIVFCLHYQSNPLLTQYTLKMAQWLLGKKLIVERFNQ